MRLGIIDYINSENLLLIDKTIYNNDFNCPYLSGGNNMYYTNEDQRITNQKLYKIYLCSMCFFICNLA